MKNMESILVGLQHARETAPADDTKAEAEIPQPKTPIKQTKPKPTAEPKVKSATSSVPTKTIGKSSNPDFEAVKVLLRKTTRKKAERKWNDATEQDFSDLVGHLLQEYLGRSS